MAPTSPLRPRRSTGPTPSRFIVDTCRSTDGLWLVPTGPLTNIALAFRQAPDIVERISGISLMGGGSFGNRTAMGEFNIWADPEAARIVFASGAPIVMAGLDVTHQFLATPERIDAVRARRWNARHGARRSARVLLRDVPATPRRGRAARRRDPRSARRPRPDAPRPVRANSTATSRSRRAASSPAA